MSIHKGHRERMRERFLAEGLDHFSDIQILEFLLFYPNAQGDTNPIAHNLLNRFGTLSQVLDAPIGELMKVEGVGPKSALFLSLIPAVSRRYQMDKANNVVILNSIEKCGAYLVPYFHGRKNETVFLLCLDAKCKVLCCRNMGEGSVNSAGVPIRRIVETALGVNATTVILAHNHPSGIAVPSSEDVVSTRRTAAALAAVDIILVDHIIVADDDFVTLGQSGMYQPEGALYG